MSCYGYGRTVCFPEDFIILQQTLTRIIQMKIVLEIGKKLGEGVSGDPKSLQGYCTNRLNVIANIFT